jgi:chromosome segregation ATPase
VHDADIAFAEPVALQSSNSNERTPSNVEALKKEISVLKSTLGRTKNRLQEKGERMLDLKAEIQRLKADLETMEKDSDRKDELLESARRETLQYRNWWLGEVQFMKLLLNKIPEPNKDVELVRASQAHYLGHY